MTISGLSCPRCGEALMFFQSAQGYLLCISCGKKELVDDDFTMHDFWALVRREARY